MDTIVKAYDTLFYEIADARVKDWTLMRSPWPILVITASYLLLVKRVLPAHMKDRKPYNLRSILKWYNVIQIFANAVVAWGLLTSGWTTTYPWFGCVLPDYSTNPEPMRMLRFMWWTLILKMLELCETAFFILRKKEKQASFLHTYHHVSSFIIIWIATKFVGGGLASFPPMLNNIVHVIMYTYYLLSSEGSPSLKRFLFKYKKWITIIQMVQFTIMLVYTTPTFSPSCKAPVSIMCMYFPNVIFIFYMFYDFFKKNYNNKRKQSIKNQKKSDLNDNNGNHLNGDHLIPNRLNSNRVNGVH